MPDDLRAYRAQIRSRYMKLALPYPCFEQKPQPAIEKPGIDRLHQRAETRWEIFEMHHLRFIQNIPPLEVAVIASLEICKSRMFRIEQDAKCMWWAHLEPGSVPENRGEMLNDLFSLDDLPGGIEKDLAAFLQDAPGGIVQRCTIVDAIRSCGQSRRVYPTIPAIGIGSVSNGYG